MGSCRAQKPCAPGTSGSSRPPAGCGTRATPAATPYAETTAGELAQLITGRRRLGSKDIAEIHRLISELELLELSATVNRPKDAASRTWRS